jgi:hypothetical protein
MIRWPELWRATAASAKEFCRNQEFSSPTNLCDNRNKDQARASLVIEARGCESDLENVFLSALDFGFRERPPLPVELAVLAAAGRDFQAAVSTSMLISAEIKSAPYLP